MTLTPTATAAGRRRCGRSGVGGVAWRPPSPRYRAVAAYVECYRGGVRPWLAPTGARDARVKIREDHGSASGRVSLIARGPHRREGLHVRAVRGARPVQLGQRGARAA